MTQPRRDRRWTEDIRLVNEEGRVLGGDREMARQAFLEAEAILAREGGAITIMPIRVEQPPAPGSLTGEDEWMNLGYIFQHHFAPTAGRLPEQEAQGNGTVPDDYKQHLGAQESAQARTVEDFATEPAAVMAQPIDPSDQHTEPRASDLPEPAPLDPAALVPRTS